jgi:hypothetical protein
MKRNILSFINKLQSYKTAIKNLHWSAKNMSEHKLWDEIADLVADTQDEVAEIAQGIFGNIKLNELKPRRYNINNSKKTLTDITKDTKFFYATIKRGEQFVGLRSVVENFIAELEKYQYLMNFCIKEDIKRTIRNSINESKKKNSKIRITENQLRSAIKEAIDNVLTDDRKQDEINASWDAFEKTRQPFCRYYPKGHLDTAIDDDNDWYNIGKDAYDEVMDDDDNTYNSKIDDILYDYHEFSKDDDGFNGMEAQSEEPWKKTWYQNRYNQPQRKLQNFR